MYNSLNNEVDLNWLLVISVLYIFRVYVISVYKPVLRSAMRAPAKVRQLNNISDVSRRTFAGARFAERSTVCLLTGVTCTRLNLNTSLQSVHTVRTDVFLLRDHSPLPILFIYSQQCQGFIIIFMVKLCLPVYFSVLWNFW